MYEDLLSVGNSFIASTLRILLILARDGLAGERAATVPPPHPDVLGAVPESADGRQPAWATGGREPRLKAGRIVGGSHSGDLHDAVKGAPHRNRAAESAARRDAVKEMIGLFETPPGHSRVAFGAGVILYLPPVA